MSDYSVAYQWVERITFQVVASHTGEIGVLQKTTGDMAATISALEQRVAALEGAVPPEAE